MNSQKGREIEQSEKVALTFWWTEINKQVRIQGNASQISNNLADRYFAERNRDSQLVSIISQQGEDIDDPSELMDTFEREKVAKAISIIRPVDWGGFSIKPIRIEFLEFSTSRFHDRKLFQRVNNRWLMKQLQP